VSEKPLGSVPAKDVQNTSREANIASIVAVCSCVTVHNFVLDMLSLHAEDTGNLPGYYEKNSGIYIYTAVFAIISLLFLVIGIFWLIVVLVIWCRDPKEQKVGLFIPVAFCIGSTVLSLSFHVQNILLAWNIDPFYASRITLYYGVTIFVYILTFRHAYYLTVIGSEWWIQGLKDVQKSRRWRDWCWWLWCMGECSGISDEESGQSDQC